MILNLITIIGIGTPLIFLPIPWAASLIAGILIFTACSFLPVVGSAAAIGLWIWAATIVKDLPFSWMVAAFWVIGIICVIRFVLAIVADITAMREK